MKTNKLLLSAALVFTMLSFSTRVNAQLIPTPPKWYTIKFWWGNYGNTSRENGTFTSGPSDVVAPHPVFHIDLNTKVNLQNVHAAQWNGNDANDHARSCTVSGSAGIRFIVYDSPQGHTRDDWTEITLKKEVSGYYIDTFEKRQGGGVYEDEYIRMEYHRDNGLDGKVSSLIIADY